MYDHKQAAQEAKICVCAWIFWFLFSSVRGIAIGKRIYLKPSSFSSMNALEKRRIVAHELVHVAQFINEGVGMWFGYMKQQITNGYMQNRYEKEAWAREHSSEWQGAAKTLMEQEGLLDA